MTLSDPHDTQWRVVEAGEELVAVDVNAPIDNGKRRRMTPYRLLTESSRLMMQQITRYDIERFKPDILIRMSAHDYEMMEFHHARRIIQSGVEAARRALERL